MKAAVLEELKKPLQIRNVDAPEISGSEVLIRQNVTGICFRDILTVDGFFPRVRMPVVLGHEISGTIEKVGPDVEGFRIGDRVASLIYTPCGTCEFCLRGDENLCPNKKTFGETVNGGYTRYVAASASSLVKVPDNVPDVDASISACVTGMVYNAIKRVGGLEEGQKILVTGAGGGVGSHAVQIAKALGAYVIAKTSSPWKAEKLHSLGADMVVTSDSFDREIKEKLGEGVHLVLESVGLPTFERGFRSLRPSGKLVVIGNVDPTPVNLPLGLLILKGNTVSGSISSTRDDMKKALELTAQGRIRAIVHKTIRLEDVNSAHVEMKNKMSMGRIMIDVNE